MREPKHDIILRIAIKESTKTGLSIEQCLMQIAYEHGYHDGFGEGLRSRKTNA